MYFYFNTPQSEEFLYSDFIPKIYEVDDEPYSDMLLELHSHFRALQKEFKDHNDEVWSSLTLVLESTGKFQIDYHYGDVLETGLDRSQRQFVWQYKNLGILPKSEANRKFLEEYLKNHDETQK